MLSAIGRSLQRVTIPAAVLAVVLAGCGSAATSAPSETATLQPATVVVLPTPTIVAATVATTAAAEATVTAPAAAAVDLAGTYVGAIDVAGQRIDIEVTFQSAEGVLSGDLDIAAQGAFGIPLDNMTVDGSAVSFTILSGSNVAAFAGEVGADGNIAGSFSQAGYTGEFALEPAPLVVLPYRQEEVAFGHDDIVLAGTLTIPEGEGPFPAVVLISGSGAQDRDENVYGFRVFFTIADHLTRNGIAVLRYDDRGVGGSTGDLSQATQTDLAQDALAAVDLLLAREDIDGSAIGLVGHSEGGIVAPLAANQSSDVAYLVLLAGTATPGEEVLMDQLELIMKAQGATEEEIAAARARQLQSLTAVKTGEGWKELTAEVEAELRAAIAALPEEQRKALGNIDEYVEYAIASEIASIDNPWFRAFVEYDPVPALESLQVPVLGVFGALDTQVPPVKNAQAMQQALETAGVDFRIEILPEANHLLQQAVTGGVDEYATRDQAFAPGFLDLITEWILQQAG